MSNASDKPDKSKTLEVLLLAYAVSSLLHFIQDAQYARTHPQSGWDSVSSVYITWIAISAIGALGYLLHRSSLQWVGRVLLSLYAAVGLDAASHYTQAPITAYSGAMNISIGVQVIMAFVLLMYALIAAES
jgi:uncharacterized membrane protein